MSTHTEGPWGMASPVPGHHWDDKQAAANRLLIAALEEALRIASDENGEVFGDDMNARETAIIAWKRQAQDALAKARGES